MTTAVRTAFRDAHSSSGISPGVGSRRPAASRLPSAIAPPPTSAAKAAVSRTKSLVPMDFPTIGVPWVMHGLATLYGRSGIAKAMPPLANVVISNVPGPQQPLYMGGSRVRDMMFWVPQTGSIGIGVSILSYNGRVHFGLIADAKLIPDPDAVIRRFGSEFDKLLYLALMGNWDHRLDARGATALVPAAIPAGS